MKIKQNNIIVPRMVAILNKASKKNLSAKVIF